MKVVQHYRCSPATAPDATDLAEVLEGIRSAMTALWQPGGDEFYVYEGVDGVFWDAGGNEHAGTVLNPVIGGSPGTVNPASTALVISWRVAQRWRGGHSRSYMPGIPNGQLASAHTFQGSYVAAWQTRATAYIDAIAGITFGALTCESLAVLRRFADGGSETVPKTYLDPPELIDVESAIARTDVGSQRRRLGHFDG